MSANSAISQALDDFIQRYQQKHGILKIEYDSRWPSLCYAEQAADAQIVAWQPVLREQPVDFSALEQALAITLDEQLKVFFSRYWSNHLDAVAEQGKLQLLQAWNEEDFERLQQNIVGHVLMKRQLGQAETVFFGLTDEDDFILSVALDTGAVVLEQIGLEPQKILASCLSEFIQLLQPT